MEIELSDEMWQKINNGNVKAKDFVKYVLENTFLHFKIKDLQGVHPFSFNISHKCLFRTESLHLNLSDVPCASIRISFFNFKKF